MDHFEVCVWVCCVGLVVSCADPSEEEPAPETLSCEALTEAAVEDVLEVVDANLSCTVDGDCVVVGINGGCFDVCSRAVAAGGAEAVSSAIDDARGTHCADFDAQSCQFIVPPCAPPGEPRCVEGRCQEM